VGNFPAQGADVMRKVLLALIIACCFTLATALEPYFEELHGTTLNSSSVLVSLLGDSRRMFANHFFSKADAYFHSGFYPGIFDQPEAAGHEHIREEAHGEEAGHHEEEETFLGAPRDFIDRFGRNFYPTIHTHLHGGNEREMLPWLKLSADLDPQNVETFITGAYWLERLQKPKEAEQFLREGLWANPDSHEILLELGRIYAHDKNDPATARNLFNLALKKWQLHDARGEKPDPEACDQIYGELVRLDKQEGNRSQLLSDLEELEKFSPDKEAIARSIADLKAQPTPAR
jgi:tetratricopeptide (TPR) repeat protein